MQKRIKYSREYEQKAAWAEAIAIYRRTAESDGE